MLRAWKIVDVDYRSPWMLYGPGHQLTFTVGATVDCPVGRGIHVFDRPEPACHYAKVREKMKARITATTRVVVLEYHPSDLLDNSSDPNRAANEIRIGRCAVVGELSRDEIERLGPENTAELLAVTSS